MKARTVRTLARFVLVFVYILVGSIAGCTNAEADKKVTSSGVRYFDIKEGEGDPCQFGDVVHFSYVGKLADGQQFEKCDRDHPAMTRRGWQSPIAGLDDGLEGMKVGGIRKIWVPASLGYGVHGSPGKIPPNADLVFEDVEMLKVMTPPKATEEAQKNREKNAPPKAIADAEKKIRKGEITKPTGKDVPDAERKEVVLKSGLKYLDLRIGDGDEINRGNQAFVLYAGRFTNGQVFEASKDKSNPFQFVIGEGRVIKGWEEGVPGMRVGGRRVLWIPPELAYGNKHTEKIPANSTLVFEIELVRMR
jgi:peptidylprolyl isomerase